MERTVFLLPLVLFLSACDCPKDDRVHSFCIYNGKADGAKSSTIVLPPVSVVTDWDVRGGCSGSLPHFYVQNNTTTSTYDVVLTQYVTAGGTTTTSDIGPYTLAPGEKNALGCADSGVDASPKQFYNWTVKQYYGTKAASFGEPRQYSSFVSWLTQVGGVIAPAANCYQACIVDRSPQCYRYEIEKGGQNSIRKGLSELTRRLTTKSQRSISSADMMRMFGMEGTTDPCARGPTSFKSVSLENRGNGDCVLLISEPSADLRVTVPSTLRGERRISEEDGVKRLELRFPNPRNAASLAVDLDNHDRGQTALITGVVAWPHEIVLEQQNSCVHVLY